MRKKYFYVVLLACASVPSHAWAVTPPAIYNLGTLSGGSDSYGGSINAIGQITGSSRTPAGTDAFLYSGPPGSGVMMDLGAIGGGSSYGAAINASGQVTGDNFFPNPTIAAYHAFRYDGVPGSGGVMLDLGTLGGTHSHGNGINASGQVAGWSYTTGDAASRAFVYSGTPGSGGVMVDIGTLGGTNSSAYAINNSGQVTGDSDSPTGEHAFLYTPTPGGGGTMADLGTLFGGVSIGYAINDHGQVVGVSVNHAFLYSGTPGRGGSMTDLGTLGGDGSVGNAINSSGTIVGVSDTAGNAAQHAFLYTGTPGLGGHMIDLDVWLKANNPTEGAKWTLNSAGGLTDTGVVVGTGVYNDGPGGLSDGTRAFLLDASSLVVSEPSSWILLTTGALALMLRRRILDYPDCG